MTARYRIAATFVAGFLLLLGSTLLQLSIGQSQAMGAACITIDSKGDATVELGCSLNGFTIKTVRVTSLESK